MSERIGDWIQTYSSRQWWPHDPRPEDVHHEDFPAVAQVTRFGGSCRLASRPEPTFPRYTIGQHMCLVHDFLRENRRCSGDPALVAHIDRTTITLLKSALTHDLHEIYPPGDQLAPFTRLASGNLPPESQAGVAWLRWVSREAAFTVRKAIGAPLELPDLVRHADLVLLATERRDLTHPAPDLRAHWAELPEPWERRIEVWSAERAWVEWRARFADLFGYAPGGP